MKRLNLRGIWIPIEIKFKYNKNNIKNKYINNRKGAVTKFDQRDYLGIDFSKFYANFTVI